MSDFRKLSWLTFALVVAGLFWAVSLHWGAITNQLTIDRGRLFGTVAFNAAGLGLLALSWGLLHAVPDRLRHTRRFLIIQPAKHIPGGIAHLAGQVILTRELNRSGPASATSLVVHAFAMVVGASVVATASFAVVGSWKLAALSMVAGLVAAVAARAGIPLLGRVRLPSRLRWLRVEAGSLPTMGTFGLVVLAASLGIAGLGLAFTLVSEDISTSNATLVGAFAFAWAVGFLALPFPGGLGVREGILVVLLASSVSAGVVLAAALLQRVAQVVAELGLSIASGFAERRLSN